MFAVGRVGLYADVCCVLCSVLRPLTLFFFCLVTLSRLSVLSSAQSVKMHLSFFAAQSVKMCVSFLLHSQFKCMCLFCCTVGLNVSVYFAAQSV